MSEFWRIVCGCGAYCLDFHVALGHPTRQLVNMPDFKVRLMCHPNHPRTPLKCDTCGLEKRIVYVGSKLVKEE